MQKVLQEDDVVHIGYDVFQVSGSNTNWVVIKDGDSCTLVDTGYPGDHDALLASLDAVGLSPRSVVAVLVTHAHNDHIGSAERLRLACDAPVLMHHEEVPHARRIHLNQVSTGQVLAQAWRPGVIPWAVHALRAGGKAHVPVLAPQALPAMDALDLPGAPVPIHTPGHTAGHSAYHLPDRGILITGDALVTAHPTSRRSGPQLLHDMFHTDRSRALDALEAIELVDAEVIAPGHGPAYRGLPKEAVALVRTRAKK
ncbi:MBL fold metallo-hydrolase [Streptomyces sp. NPDC004589]|uniref:MBL fold metallo-hydrolase n=1 Tax=Streptomyces sp. NPDC004589 TaxID=3154553 RepID=UPI0033A60358